LPTTKRPSARTKKGVGHRAAGIDTHDLNL
jgi:hypothetical protein